MLDSQNKKNKYSGYNSKDTSNRVSSYYAQNSLNNYSGGAKLQAQNNKTGSSTWARMAAESDKRRAAELERQRKIDIQRLAEEDIRRRAAEQQTGHAEKYNRAAEDSGQVKRGQNQSSDQTHNTIKEKPTQRQAVARNDLKDKKTIPFNKEASYSAYDKHSSRDSVKSNVDLYGDSKNSNSLTSSHRSNKSKISFFGKAFNVPSVLWPDKKAASVAALDGLRALAIIGVILYHLGFGWMRGGLIGVTVFFVLSGYLITGIICNLYERGKFSLKTFWIRRIRRLFPAVVVVVLLVLILCAIFNHVLLTKMRPDVLPSIFFFQNWWYIIRDLSYFDNLGDPSPLIHFWSLAIEEQFYIFWPLLILLAKKAGLNNRWMFVGCLILAGLSAGEMALMYQPDADPTRVYYGTDTRAFSLLIGAALSIALPWQKLRGAAADKSLLAKFKSPTLVNAFGFASLIGILVIMIFVDGVSPFMYWGVLLLASVLSAILIAALVIPGNLLEGFFATGPMVWIGKRSYSLYLWHLPMILLLKPIVGDFTDVWWFALLVIAVSTILAALQYRFIEEPCRHGAIGRIWNRVKSSKTAIKRYGAIAGASAAACIVLVACIFAIPDETIVPEEAIKSTGQDVSSAMMVSDTVLQLERDGESEQVDISEIDPDELNEMYKNGVLREPGKLYPLLVGDSVPAAVTLQNYFAYSLNDSVKSRTAAQGVSVLQGYADQKVLSNVVVFDCFTNHNVDKSDLDSVFNIVGPDRQLFLVTSYSPYPCSAENNKLIASFCTEHSNVHPVDWATVASNNVDTYLYRDHIHLTTEGQKAFVKVLASAINDCLPKECKCDITKIDATAQATANR